MTDKTSTSNLGEVLHRFKEGIFTNDNKLGDNSFIPKYKVYPFQEVAGDEDDAAGIKWADAETCHKLYTQGVLDPNLANALKPFDGYFAIMMLHSQGHAICTVVLPGDCKLLDSSVLVRMVKLIVIMTHGDLLKVDNVRVINIDMVDKGTDGFDLEHECKLQLGKLAAYINGWTEDANLGSKGFNKALEVWDALGLDIHKNLEQAMTQTAKSYMYAVMNV